MFIIERFYDFSLSNLKSLEKLDVGRCKFRRGKLPPVISKLTSLVELGIYECELNELPD